VIGALVSGRRHSPVWSGPMAAKGSPERYTGRGRGRFVPCPGKKVDRRRRTTLAADGSWRGARGRQSRRGLRGRHAQGLSLLRRAVAQLGPRPLDQALDPQSPIGPALAQ
jgi:hypothetical protein